MPVFFVRIVMVSVKNKQKKIEIATRAYKKRVTKLLDFLGHTDFDLAIVFVTSAAMQKINKKFRSQDAVTDVISFPYHENIKAGQPIKVFLPDDKNLGDIIVCPEYILENKKQFLGTFQQRMDYMIVHGLAHLLGYDHQTDADFKKMNAFEQSVMKIFSGG